MDAIQNSGKRLFPTILAKGKVLAIMTLFGSLLGCTTISYPLGPTTPPPSYQFLTGNWEFTTSPTSGSAQFGLFAGFIDEQSVDAGVNDPVTTSLQIEEPATCFVGTIVVPLQGDLKASDLELISFTDVSQFLSIVATKDATATHLTGTYSVGGGCASGSQGTLSGTRYAPLAGTYSGPVTGPTSTTTLSLVLAQSLQGNGDGTSNVTGRATIAGNSCFSTATFNLGDGTVLGSKLNLSFNTNDGSQMTVVGTFDPTADRITAASTTVTGGACAGSLGTASLQLQ